MDQERQSRWQPTRRQLLWAGAAVALLTVAVLIGYSYGITLWNWIKLLIVPAAIAAGGVWFNQQQREREDDIAQQRAQDEALQAYLGQMGQLLLDKGLRQSKEGDEVRTLARSRTCTLLARLDGDRKGSVMQFLYESGLITKDRVVVDLTGADLRRAELRGADLRGADLRKADLSGANLRTTRLREANLRSANLTKADLSRADLTETDLSWVSLNSANFWKARLLLAQLDEWTTLEGAIMPNGQKYEEWLRRQHKQHVERKRREMRGDPDREAHDLAEKLERLERRRSNYIDLAADGLMSREDLRTKLAEADRQREDLQEALLRAQGRQQTIEELERAWHIASQMLQLTGITYVTISPEDRRRFYMALQLRVEIGADGTITLRGIFDPEIRLLDLIQDPPIDPSEPVPKVPEETRVVVATPYTPSSSTVRTDNIPKVRFSATVGEEPEIELALV